MGVVVFSASDFREQYPEFASNAGFSDAMLGGCFARSTLLLDNTDASPVPEVETRTMLLYLLTAHAAALWQRGSGNVGRVASAGEGSVSASFEMAGPINAAWYNQTQYGAMYWQATLTLRSGRYVAASCPSVLPWL